MVTLDLDGLKGAIRTASTLEDLYRLIGPSKEEEDRARQRLTQLDALANRCDFGSMCPDFAASVARERYDRIMKAQAAFEARYR